eukprot:CAMPEP_0201694222 /NCGR_PEP_ID=MMETSP0578-20130828/6561_1 /ASSEMBLY_ACC=CAM_ASM_000663 /TAXON_ID=267565 /ORGANISM="Skeletonema grethea, Strain CCMP 1804" /LENGTH=440 /DNA_ID=CAMNT_0048179873 /DNA_START=78 /DNA_END=1400 /DNA_ORIENTATION=-
MAASTHPTQKFDETIDNLSRSTQSLLRTMRLDVVLLGSQQQESQSTLSKLEQDWEMLQKLLEQQRKKEAEEQEEEGTKNVKEKEQIKGTVAVDTHERTEPIKPQTRRHSSAIEWSEDELFQGGDNNPNNTSNDQEEHLAIRTLKLPDFSNPSNASNKATERLDRSNLDWGTVDIGDMEEEDRKADQSAPLTLDSMLKQDSKNADASDDDLPPIKRMFGWGRGDKRDSKLSTNSSTLTTTESSSFFGRRRVSVTKKHEGDDAASAITECATNTSSRNSFTWQALFRRDGSNNTRGSDERRIDEKNNVPSSANTPKEDLSEAISTMQVKLRGCDSAASSLHQLVSFQKRQITDLQHERNQLKVLSEFQSLHGQSELKSLVTQMESARVERERKELLLKEAEKCRSIFVDKEEKLKEELECIRMELFMLNMQLETDSRESTSL